MIQQQSTTISNAAQPPPRLHPKKRKFDLSELENDHQPTTSKFVSTASSSSSACNNQNVSMCAPQTTGMTVICQKNDHNGGSETTNFLNYPALNQNQMTKCDAQQFVKKSYNSPTSNSKAIAASSQQQNAPLMVVEQELVDLKEWCNHRVLAKQKDFYVPGVIRPTNLPNSVLVNLDYPEAQQQLFQDIFAVGRFDVISDASPSLSDVRILI